MCGIVGFIRTDKTADSAHILNQCLKAIAHRGPDDRQQYVDSSIALGFCRLSIIDLTTGAQPLFNEDKSIVLLCNGEIYNYRALKKNLIENGHIFRTESDCEVLVHLYEDKGDNFIDDVDGMFAICIWDARTRKLMLFRDRMGIKPLYYYHHNGQMVFGSELKAILRHPVVSREINEHGFAAYTSLNYIPYPDTIYRHIYKVPPANKLVLQAGNVICVPYWEDWQRVPATRSMDEQQWVYTLRKVFLDAVNKRLMADVPLGVLLSGGLDSSAIVAALSILGETKVPTYSVVFSDQPQYSEEPFSSQVAKHFGTDHTVMDIKSDCLDDLEQVIVQMDEPIADKALVPTYLIFKEASRSTKVLLSGEGADELFLGYRKYQILKKLPTGQMPCMKYILPYIKRFRRFHKLGSYLALSKSVEKAILWDTVFLDSEKKRILAQPEQCVYNATHGSLPDLSNFSLEQQMMFWDLFYFLPENLLMKVDKLSMAHGVEARVPYLDMSFVREVMRIPISMKLKHRQSKYLLRRMFAQYLPESIVNRPKHGFTVPIKEWIGNNNSGLIARYLNKGKLEQNSYFDIDAVQQILTAHCSGKQDHTRQIWNILTWQIWASHNGFA